MDSSFAFPRPQAPVPRPKPVNTAGSTVRESNALRASVLDVALELGIGNNSIVADWMFNNAVAEEDEGEYPVSSPSLTYGSSATSEESSSSALTPSSSISSKQSGAGAPYGSNSKSALKMGGMLQINEVEPDVPNFESNFASNTISFPDVPIPPRPITPVSKKLKKKQRPDGYESDGGYLSEGPSKRKEKKSTSKDAIVFPSTETEKEAKKRAKEEQKETDEMERKKKKSLLSAVKASRKADRKDAEQTKAYDTDGGGLSSTFKKVKAKKSKSKLNGDENDGGYETDGVASTPVKKSKTRFFKLSNKSSRPDLRVEPVPAMPMSMPKEVVPLPIAERFATTLSPTAGSPSSPLQTRSETTSPSVGSVPFIMTDILPAPLPPLSFQPFASSSSEVPETEPQSRSSPPSSLQSPANRGSQASVETSLSNGLMSKMETASNHSTSHGQGSGSHSTLVSSQSHLGSGPPQTTLPSPPNSGRTSGSSGTLALPTISYPNTRSTSPNLTSPVISTPPVVPLQIAKNLRMKPSLENINLSNRIDMSPSPFSPSMGIPLRSAAPSPALVSGRHSPLPPHSSSPLPNKPDRLGIPRSPGGYLPSRSPSPSPHGYISPPLNSTDLRTPRPTQLTIPTGEYHGQTPSPRHSGLPSPNVLAYYDIPPPSPPPMGPLPTIPPHAANANQTTMANPGHFPSPSVLRQRVIDRTPRQLPPEFGGLIQAQANIQRGKESPFPSRPVMPGGTLPASGLVRSESRVNGTARYRDVYPQATAASGSAADFTNHYNGEDDEDVQDVRRTRFRDDLSFINSGNSETATDNGDEYVEDLRDVLDRYDDGYHRSEHEDAEETGSLSYKRSTETTTTDEDSSLGYTAMTETPRPRIPRSAPVEPVGPEARETLYQFEDDGRTVGDRTSRWSGSIYSRASFLDEDSSGKTRERLVDQVEKMLAMEANRGPGGGSSYNAMGRGYIPPVPRLPDAYANQATPARSWNRF